MKQYISTLAILILFVFQSQGQNDSAFRWGGIGSGFVGIQSLNFDNTNSTLENESIYRDNINLQFGGSGFLLLGSKYVIMGQGHGSIYSNENSNGSSIRPTYGGGGFNFGYTLINKNQLLLFPTIGIGAAGYNLKVENNEQTDISFGNYTISSNEKTEFKLSNSYLDINLNLYKLIDIGKGDNDVGGISMGLSLGYQLSLGDSNWTELNSTSDIQGLDSNKASSFYLRLLIGGGGFEF